MSSLGIVRRHLNRPASTEMLCPHEEEVLDRIIQVRLDRLVEAQVLDTRREQGICQRLVFCRKNSYHYFSDLFPPGFALVLDNFIQVAVALRALPDKKIRPK